MSWKKRKREEKRELSLRCRVGIHVVEKEPSWTWERIKWCRMSICFDRADTAGELERAHAAWLSLRIGFLARIFPDSWYPRWSLAGWISQVNGEARWCEKKGRDELPHRSPSDSTQVPWWPTFPTKLVLHGISIYSGLKEMYISFPSISDSNVKSQQL